MNQKWWQRLKILISPTAVGIYLTLTFVGLCYFYYMKKDDGLKSGFVVQSIRKAHEISIDYRLLARGPISPTAPVVLLTVDEKAVNVLGRWPWPREVIAKSIRRAFEDGVKVMGFDMIFSEPERNEILSTSEDLYRQGLIDTSARDKMKAMALSRDGDSILAHEVALHKKSLVAGSFYQYFEDTNFPPGDVDFCNDLVFHDTPQFSLWDQEEALISVQDPLQVSPPFALTEIFSQRLKGFKTDLLSKYGQNLGRLEENRAQEEVLQKMHEMCYHFFDDVAKDALEDSWNQISAQMNPADFPYKTYAEWLQDFRSKMMANGVPRVSDWVLNIPLLQNSFANTGYFNANQDSDGTFRGSPLVTRTGFYFFPSLALKTYLVGTDRNASLTFDYNPATGRKEISKFEITDNNTGEVVSQIPTDGQGRLQINYAGPQKMFPHLSFADLLSDSDKMVIQQTIKDPETNQWVPQDITVSRKEFLKGKYLLVGATAKGIFDLRVTPFEKKDYPGLEIHANVLANLLDQNFLRPLKDERSEMPIFLLFLGVLHTLLLTQFGALGGMGMTATLLAGLLGADKFILFDHGIIATVVWPLFEVAAIYTVLTTFRYLTEERGKKELRATFQKYVSPSIVEEILSDPKNIELGGKKMDLTVFFSDVRGFTTISEKLDPHALSELLNQYLTPMTDIIFSNQGTLDKYMGDAIMAFFGAPIPMEKHAHFACRAALQTLTKLFELQREFAAKGLPQIDIGIGLNSGEVSAGNMGSQTVRSYTVMGDAVNLASRLEGINKQYGTRIVLSEFTYERVKEAFTCREIDWVRVKGKSKPVKIYELLKEGALAAPAAEHLKVYRQAYSLYRSQNWLEAQEQFSRSLDLDPEDHVSRMFLERCAQALESPPDSGWDGVFEMKTK